MTYEVHKYEDEDFDDLIILDEIDEFKERIWEDLQITDADIIDYGISEDEYEGANPSLPAASESTVTVSNVPNINKIKTLSIKIVDCFKYPWYYKKYRKQILEQTYFENVESIARFVLQCANARNRYAPTIGCDNTTNSLDDVETNIIRNRSVISDTYTTIDDKASNLKNKIVELNIVAELNNYKHKKNIEKEKTVNQINSNETVDIRKNKGLVGIKIQRMSVDDEPRDYVTKKEKKSKHKENVEKQKYKKISSSYAKAVDKTIQKFDTAAIPVNNDNQKNKTPEGYQNKSNDKNLHSKPNHTNKSAGVKCSLKNLSPKILEMVKQIMPVNRDKSVRDFSHSRCTDINLKKDDLFMEKSTICSKNTTSNLIEHSSTNLNYNNTEKYKEDHNKIIKDVDMKVIPYKPMPKSKREEMLKRKGKQCQKNTCQQDILQMNKFTEKVLKIKENKTPQMDRKTSTKENFKKNCIISNKPSSEEKIKPKPRKANDISKSIMPVEKTKHIHFNANTNNTKSSKEIVIVNKNNPMQKQNIDVYTNLNKCFQIIKSNNFVVQANNQEPSVSHKSNSYTEPNPTEESKNVQVQPMISTSNVPKSNKNDELVRTRPLLTNTLNQEPKPPRLPQTKSNRKQQLKVLSVENMGRVEEYMKLNLSGQARVQPLILQPQTPPENLGTSHNHGYAKEHVKVNTCNNTKVKPSVLSPDKWINPATITSQSPPDSAKQYQNHLPIPTIIGGINLQGVKNIGNEHIAKIVTLKSHMPQNTPISAVVIKPIQAPSTAFSNTLITSVSTKSHFINTPEGGSNIAKPMVTRPVPSSSNVPLKHVRLPRKIMQQQPNYIFPFSQGNQQRMPMYNGNAFWNKNYYMQNKYVQQPVYTAENRIDRVVGNTNIPPGICDVHPSNINWTYSYGFPLQPPPPPPPRLPPPRPPPLLPPARPSAPPLPHFNDISVIGKNGDGFVKKINIPTPLVDSEIDGKAGEVIRHNINEHTTAQNKTPLVTMDTTPVLSKTEMMAELEKAVVIDNPVKKDLKRPLPCEQIKQTSPLRKCRPGPLSKKFKLSERADMSPQDRQKSQPHKGYSPPILPIPSYQTILAETKTPTFEKQFNVPSADVNRKRIKNKLQNILAKKIKTCEEAKEDNQKKITLHEYKMRNTNNGTKLSRNKLML